MVEGLGMSLLGGAELQGNFHEFLSHSRILTKNYQLWIFPHAIYSAKRHLISPVTRPAELGAESEGHPLYPKLAGDVAWWHGGRFFPNLQKIAIHTWGNISYRYIGGIVAYFSQNLQDRNPHIWIDRWHGGRFIQNLQGIAIHTYNYNR